jgi:predicted alpha/beta superfamily hydrolase
MITMNKFKPTTLPATELRHIKSKTTGKNYQISIAVPLAYTDDSIKFNLFDKPLASWPVVYVLDSNWFFGMVTGMVRIMSWDGRKTDALVVGIGYPEMETPQESVRNVFALRTDDLTPTRGATSEKYHTEWLKREVISGGGVQFLNFIKQELIPWIDQDYRTDPEKRTLVGHSYGGLFSLFAMFQEPGLFSSYIVSSPTLNFSEDFMFTLESEFAKKHKRLPAQLYLAAGEMEEGVEDTTLTAMYRFAALLESRKYKGLSLTKQVFLDNNHCEVPAPAFQAGLKLVLKKS